TPPGDRSMKRLLSSATLVLALACQSATAQNPAPTKDAKEAPAPAAAAPAQAQQPAARGQGRGNAPPAIQAKAEELAKIKEKTEQLEALVKEAKAKRAAAEMVTDVEVYAYAGKMLLEYPELFGTQQGIDHAFVTLDQGIERAKQLLANEPGWNQGQRQ